MTASLCKEQNSLHIQEETEIDYANKSISTLLIVDDSPLIVKSLTELLEDNAAITSILSCGTYNKAIDLISICNPVAVLLDIDLPDKSGITLLKYIKTFNLGITAIVVTNQSDELYKGLCLELGAYCFLDKSNDFDKLPGLIASLIQ